MEAAEAHAAEALSQQGVAAAAAASASNILNTIPGLVQHANNARERAETAVHDIELTEAQAIQLAKAAEVASNDAEFAAKKAESEVALIEEQFRASKEAAENAEKARKAADAAANVILHAPDIGNYVSRAADAVSTAAKAKHAAAKSVTEAHQHLEKARELATTARGHADAAAAAKTTADAHVEAATEKAAAAKAAAKAATKAAATAAATAAAKVVYKGSVAVATGLATGATGLATGTVNAATSLFNYAVGGGDGGPPVEHPKEAVAQLAASPLQDSGVSNDAETVKDATGVSQAPPATKSPVPTQVQPDTTPASAPAPSPPPPPAPLASPVPPPPAPSPPAPTPASAPAPSPPPPPAPPAPPPPASPVPPPPAPPPAQAPPHSPAPDPAAFTAPPTTPTPPHVQIPTAAQATAAVQAPAAAQDANDKGYISADQSLQELVEHIKQMPTELGNVITQTGGFQPLPDGTKLPYNYGPTLEHMLKSMTPHVSCIPTLYTIKPVIDELINSSSLSLFRTYDHRADDSQSAKHYFKDASDQSRASESYRECARYIGEITDRMSKRYPAGGGQYYGIQTDSKGGVTDSAINTELLQFNLDNGYATEIKIDSDPYYFAFFKENSVAIGVLMMHIDDTHNCLEVELVISTVPRFGPVMMKAAEIFALSFGLRGITLRAALSIPRTDQAALSTAQQGIKGKGSVAKRASLATEYNQRAWWGAISEGKTLPQYYAKLGYIPVVPAEYRGDDTDAMKAGFLANQNELGGFLMYKLIQV